MVESRVATATLVVGLDRAIRRYTETLTTQDEQGRFIYVAEVLSWVHSIEQRIAAKWQGAGKGREWFTHVADGEIIQGFRFARNRVHHHWADAVRYDSDGYSYPLSFSMTYGEWRWRTALPPGRRDDRGEAAYLEHLAECAVRHTIPKMRAVIDEVTTKPAGSSG